MENTIEIPNVSMSEDEYRRMNERKERLEALNKDYEHAIDFWDFPFLESSLKLRDDIGETVYFARGEKVYKGVITTINPFGMCSVKFLPEQGDFEILVSHSELYKNIRYALLDAEYNWIKRREKSYKVNERSGWRK